MAGRVKANGVASVCGNRVVSGWIAFGPIPEMINLETRIGAGCAKGLLCAIQAVG